MDEIWPSGKLTTLSDVECRRLLGQQQVGRVAWCDVIGPVIVPVNYAIDDAGGIRFRTEPGSALVAHLDRGALTFQVDEFDPFTASGWSVLVRGHAHYVNPPSAALAPQPEPWASGDRGFNICITPQIITGRRVIPT